MFVNKNNIIAWVLIGTQAASNTEHYKTTCKFFLSGSSINELSFYPCIFDSVLKYSIIPFAFWNADPILKQQVTEKVKIVQGSKSGFPFDVYEVELCIKIFDAKKQDSLDLGNPICDNPCTVWLVSKAYKLTNPLDNYVRLGLGGGVLYRGGFCLNRSMEYQDMIEESGHYVDERWYC